MSHSHPRFGMDLLREIGLWLSDTTDRDASASRHGFLPKLPGDGTKYLDGNGVWQTLPGTGGTSVASYAYTPRSSNTLLGLTDSGRFVRASAAFTQTFDAAATLGSGWFVVIHNATTDGTSLLVLDPNGAEQIDSLTTITMYSGECRLVMCTGSAFKTQLLQGGFALFTAGGNFIVPPGITMAVVECIGAGGGGAGGRGGAAGSVRQGGAGGGGGARNRIEMPGSILGAAGASIAVTIGTAGTAGTGGSSADGVDGGVGGTTTFGTLVSAYGGGGGCKGQATNNPDSGGGGGGIGAAGAVGANNVGCRGGGANATPTGAFYPSGIPGTGGMGASPPFSGTGNDVPFAEWGGGCGGSVAGQGNFAAYFGGASIWGAGGGGGGGSLPTSNAENAAGDGGGTGSGALGGGGGGGAGAANGGVGTGGGAGDFRVCGKGGGGGGSQDSGTGGAGGAGGAPGGGGGGGGGGTTVGGAGGAGGRGECRVRYA